MTTAADRLRALSGPGATTAGARLRRIGLAGATAAALLVSYSGLPSGSAAEHLLAERAQAQPARSDAVQPGGPWSQVPASALRKRHGVDLPAAADPPALDRRRKRRDEEELLLILMNPATRGVRRF